MLRSTLTLAGSALLLTSGCTQVAPLTVRAKTGGLEAGDRSAEFRVAEARGQFALGNVALAAEGFRRALREDPASISALNGIAACYDRMGRFDLSRGYYERALALAPSDVRLYRNLATSLDLQGKAAEAAGVRSELAARLKAAQTATVALEPTQAPAGNAVAPMQATQAAPAVSVALAPATDELAPSPTGPRLERVGLGEVMLLTSGAPRWANLSSESRSTPPEAVSRTAALSVTLLNAARTEGLAARTRARLHRLGWGKVTIGNAPRVLPSSEIIYPVGRRADAVRLSRQLGISLRVREGLGRRLVVRLGRDTKRMQPEA